MPGYDFKLYRWGELRGSHPTLVEQVRFEHTFTVPDGMWMMRVPENVAYARRYKALGRPEALNMGTAHSRYGHETLLFSPEPFVVVNVYFGEDLDGRDYAPTGAYLRRAQQVHKGQLGQFVPIELPLVAREAPSRVNPWTKPRDRQRGYIGWVRLTEAAKMAGLYVDQFVLDHWLFVEARDRSYFAPEFQDVRLEMICASTREHIHKQVVHERLRRAPNRTEFKAMLADVRTDWSQYWIRRGFARTVLLLQRFGWNKAQERQLLDINGVRA